MNVEVVQVLPDVVVRGHFHRARGVYKVGVHAEVVVVLPEKRLQMLDAHAHANDAERVALRIADHAVREQSDFAVRCVVVIHVRRVGFAAFQQVVIPIVGRIFRIHRAIRPGIAVVTPGIRRYQEHGFVAVQLVVLPQVGSDRLIVARIVLAVALFGEQKFEQAVVRHGERHVERLRKRGVELVVHAARRKAGHLLDVLKGGSVIGLVAQRRRDDESPNDDQADQDVGPHENPSPHLAPPSIRETADAWPVVGPMRFPSRHPHIRGAVPMVNQRCQRNRAESTVFRELRTLSRILRARIASIPLIKLAPRRASARHSTRRQSER